MSEKKSSTFSNLTINLFFFCLFISTLTLSACGSDGGGKPNGDMTKTVKLTWDPSPTEDVIGYKIYYNVDDETFPIGIIGAEEGTSPVDVGPATSFEITGLSSNETHYFTATAYDSAGYESSYSNIVTSLPETH